jgi:hypothetical protein
MGDARLDKLPILGACDSNQHSGSGKIPFAGWIEIDFR